MFAGKLWIGLDELCLDEVDKKIPPVELGTEVVHGRNVIWVVEVGNRGFVGVAISFDEVDRLMRLLVYVGLGTKEGTGVNDGSTGRDGSAVKGADSTNVLRS